MMKNDFAIRAMKAENEGWNEAQVTGVTMRLNVSVQEFLKVI